MSASILDGIQCSKQIRYEIAERVKRLKRKPGLVVLLVGENVASQTYVRNKEKAAREVGFKIVVRRLSSTVGTYELEAAIDSLNRDPTIDGYIVQLPLPEHFNVVRLVKAMSSRKDVDGFSPINQGLLLRGEPKIVPATPRGIIELLKRNGIFTARKRVVIVGRSAIVGRPLGALLLLDDEMGNATVTIAHSQTPDLVEVCREADILIAAIGKPHFISTDFVKNGAVVVDVGINYQNGKLCGDVEFDSVREVASAITPVPGGIGPMTIAMLLQNTLEAAELA